MISEIEHPLYVDLSQFISHSEVNKKWYNSHVDEIKLIEDWIEIIGLQFDLRDLTAEANNIDIWLHNGFYYFTFEKANYHAGLLWKRLPSLQEWKKFIEFLPWDTQNKVLFLRQVMKFPLSWFRCWDNSFFCNFWEDAGYWSSTWNLTHWYNLLFKNNYLNPGDFDFKWIWFLVRCLKN